MVFSSQIFLFYFLPLVLAGYALAPKSLRNTFLTLVSYVFYGWWSPWFVTLMLGSTVIDWFCGVAVTAPGASERKRKTAVAVSVIANLSLLGFFKYFVFVQENLNALIELCGANPTRILTIVLPVGISFYSFQSMSYTIDLYRGDAKRAQRFGDFACYVAMFPQLVAGPIVRYRELAEQLAERPGPWKRFEAGSLTFMIGFAKKVLIANTVGEIADLCFESAHLSPGAAWFGLLAYASQIYFDFSGYSDMAIGLGLMFGFQLPLNFQSPYRSASITEFWRRWHISLSTWLRDYLYLPLGGNRRGIRITYRNLVLVMLLGGLWHGAQWTFLVWGAFHGAFLILERLAGKRSAYERLPRPIRIALTFALVSMIWIPFRAPNLTVASEYFAALFTGLGDVPQAAVLEMRIFRPDLVFAFVVALALVFLAPTTDRIVARIEGKWLPSVPVVAAFTLAIISMMAQAENPFLYFQF
tara:strand:- start:212 stop:1621 length:1410 start_codon:yes stop_codon:yes gene_type:complete